MTRTAPTFNPYPAIADRPRSGIGDDVLDLAGQIGSEWLYFFPWRQ
jgi:hypothetical protein